MSVASHKMHLDTIMIIHCQGCRPSTNGNFPFLENRGISFFSKVVYSLSIFRGHHPLPSQVFHCTGIPISHDSICTFNNQMKIYKKIEGCEQSRVGMGARVARVVMEERMGGQGDQGDKELTYTNTLFYNTQNFIVSTFD